MSSSSHQTKAPEQCETKSLPGLSVTTAQPHASFGSVTISGCTAVLRLQERCTCTCCQLLLLRCQMRVSQQLAVIASPPESRWVRRV